MKELTAAWAEIQRTLQQASPSTQSRSSPPGGPAPVARVLTDEECLDWFIGALIEAGYAADDPVSSEDVRRALEPISVAGRRADFEGWRRRRARTMAVALAADRLRPGEIPAEWRTYYNQLNESELDVVILLLLDPLLADAET